MSLPQRNSDQLLATQTTQPRQSIMKNNKKQKTIGHTDEAQDEPRTEQLCEEILKVEEKYNKLLQSLFSEARTDHQSPKMCGINPGCLQGSALVGRRIRGVSSSD